MHRVLLLLIGIVLTLDVVLWIVSPQSLNRILVYMVLVGVLTFVCAGLAAARTRFTEVRFYVLAWLVNLIPASFFTASFAFGYRPEFVTPYDVIRLALIVDALMMGVAIFDRYARQRRASLEASLELARHSSVLDARLSALEGMLAQASMRAKRDEEDASDMMHDLRQPMQALRLSLRHFVASGLNGTNDIARIDAALTEMEQSLAGRLEARLPPPVADAAR